MSTLPRAPGVFSTVGSFLANPAVGAAVGIIGLIGSGIGSWLKRKREDEARDDAEAKYQEQVAESRKRWEQQFALTQQQFSLNKFQTMSALKQQRENQKNFYNERNNQRANQSYDKLFAQINAPQSRNTLQNIYGGRR